MPRETEWADGTLWIFPYRLDAGFQLNDLELAGDECTWVRVQGQCTVWRYLPARLRVALYSCSSLLSRGPEDLFLPTSQASLLPLPVHTVKSNVKNNKEDLM